MLRCKRRRWTVLGVAVVVVMFTLNVIFIADLSLNHSSHSSHHHGGVLQWLMPTQPPHEGPTRFISIKVLSSKSSVIVAVDDTNVYSEDGRRGMHVVILNQVTGQVMASRVFDTYSPKADVGLAAFIDSITVGRIFCFAILDEASFHLTDVGHNAVSSLGSQLIKSVGWRDMWTLVAQKGFTALGEDIGKSVSTATWGDPVNLHVSFPASTARDVSQCDWPETIENVRRRSFCARYEGYGSLCHCSNPTQLHLHPPPLPANRVAELPVAVIASNRPLYLFRMLQQLLATPGANTSSIIVYIDGFFQEPADVAGLFGLTAVKHAPKSKKNGRISQHYKSSLSSTFSRFPDAEFMIIIEEDLLVAPDFFSYFSQLKHLLVEDSTVYCVSAWNDLGYQHSCEDPALLYRVETMPGLGWLLSRKLFKELEPQWPSPDKLWDWDMWMRTDYIRKGRECIIPDVSRTFHFGESGLNMNPYFQEMYFKKHVINSVPEVTMTDIDSMSSTRYEVLVRQLLQSAMVLDHSRDPCSKGFIPDTTGKVYVLFIEMHRQNDYDHWMHLAKCFHLWDLDARGFHKGMWRFWLGHNQVMVVGSPFSPYAKDYLPVDVKPFSLAKPRKH